MPAPAFPPKLPSPEAREKQLAAEGLAFCLAREAELERVRESARRIMGSWPPAPGDATPAGKVRPRQSGSLQAEDWPMPPTTPQATMPEKLRFSSPHPAQKPATGGWLSWLGLCRARAPEATQPAPARSQTEDARQWQEDVAPREPQKRRRRVAAADKENISQPAPQALDASLEGTEVLAQNMKRRRLK